MIKNRRYTKKRMRSLSRASDTWCTVGNKSTRRVEINTLVLVTFLSIIK